jgi:hypothetical protein
MAIQLSEPVRNARLDAIETAAGTALTLELRTGAQPANCAAADSGSLIASMALPSDYMNAAATGSKTKLGTWQDPTADASGTIAHFRMKQGATCHLQGNVTLTGGGGDIQLDAVVVTSGQNITITAFTLTDANA